MILEETRYWKRKVWVFRAIPFHRIFLRIENPKSWLVKPINRILYGTDREIGVNKARIYSAKVV